MQPMRCIDRVSTFSFTWELARLLPLGTCAMNWCVIMNKGMAHGTSELWYHRKCLLFHQHKVGLDNQSFHFDFQSFTSSFLICVLTMLNTRNHQPLDAQINFDREVYFSVQHKSGRNTSWTHFLLSWPGPKALSLPPSLSLFTLFPPSAKTSRWNFNATKFSNFSPYLSSNKPPSDNLLDARAREYSTFDSYERNYLSTWFHLQLKLLAVKTPVCTTTTYFEGKKRFLAMRFQ